MTTAWKQTRLWTLLGKHPETDARDAAINILNSSMNDIETILAKSDTAPGDFTLHDEDHAFRVAERMTEVIPQATIDALSPPELALLLLSAYLHDIGMSPKRGQVSSLFSFALTGTSKNLAPEDREEFLRWLAFEGRGAEPPIARSSVTEDDLRLVSELVTYYARHKHNDWSKTWITENLTKFIWRGYPNWTDDLIDVCQSHHWGIKELLEPAFDPKVLHSKAVVHLRYLACALRVADIMENDPERTPEVVMRHRGISPGSQVYWWKDHDFVLQIESTRIVTLRARPRSAVIHRAVLQTAEAIENELVLCDRINTEKPFSQLPKGNPLPHTWNLPSSLYADVAPYKNTYTYIDGAFRPNTSRLLEILGGVELYGRPIAAIRELLQNAFDAVREHIAYERLNIPNATDAADPKWLTELGQRHTVRLDLSRDKADENVVWLTCEDDGIGMTKAIIENHLLVAGNVRRGDLLDLERRCRERGFSTGRTGKFGIGVLSYFLLASEAIIESRRSQVAGDADREAWHFSSAGVGDFGELRRMDSGVPGTRIRLRLRRNVDLGHSLLSYVAETVKWAPCNLVVNDQLIGQSMSFAPGWSLDHKGSGTRSLKDLVDIDLGADPSTREGARNRKLIDCLRVEIVEGTLPRNHGRYRIYAHYFLLGGGASLAYFEESDVSGCRSTSSGKEGDCILLKSHVSHSYKGMRVAVESDPLPRILRALGGLVHIDWTADEIGGITVNREHLLLSDEAIESLRHVLEHAKDSVVSLLRKHADSDYALFNCIVQSRHAGFLDVEPERFAWPRPSSNTARSSTWREIDFPAIVMPDELEFVAFGSSSIGELFQLVGQLKEKGIDERYLNRLLSIRWKDRPVSVLHALTHNRYEKTGFDLQMYPPDRICVFRTPIVGYAIIPMWTYRPKATTPATTVVACKFPSAWSNVIGAGIAGSTMLFNSDHFLLEYLREDTSDDLESSRWATLDSFLRGNIHWEQAASEDWDKGVLEKIREAIARRPASPQLFISNDGDFAKPSILTVITADAVKVEKQNSAVFEYLSDPGPDWNIEVKALDISHLGFNQQ
jgi:hypothetical protein